VAVWIDEFCRHVERLRECEPRVFVAMLGGGAGTMASLGEQGPPTQAKMAQRLGMGTMAVLARTLGDHQAEYVSLLGLLAATCSKIGREIYTLMKQEFGEVAAKASRKTRTSAQILPESLTQPSNILPVPGGGEGAATPA
jgi:3-carboxy-cis,cis-muconate cycloisomerase